MARMVAASSGAGTVSMPLATSHFSEVLPASVSTLGPGRSPGPLISPLREFAVVVVVKKAVRKLENEQVFDHLPDAGKRGVSAATDEDLQARLVAGLGEVHHRPALGRDAERPDGRVGRLVLDGCPPFWRRCPPRWFRIRRLKGLPAHSTGGRKVQAKEVTINQNGELGAHGLK